ncbi:hypothetical protein C8F04DRAFT_1092383 [Mycena alexandri]|uniref:Uncharacterized protein n=1 Tax=Mycena alexandri TaxID=1745969 RepID=A0AAD6X5J9_9AGAR|nr:hypothetical protein C8F04DRAFT_1092383 [Mycena alexandri]
MTREFVIYESFVLRNAWTRTPGDAREISSPLDQGRSQVPDRRPFRPSRPKIIFRTRKHLPCGELTVVCARESDSENKRKVFGVHVRRFDGWLKRMCIRASTQITGRRRFRPDPNSEVSESDRETKRGWRAMRDLVERKNWVSRDTSEACNISFSFFGPDVEVEMNFNQGNKLVPFN